MCFAGEGGGKGLLRNRRGVELEGEFLNALDSGLGV